jgi:drug/metabolite transporter (DMT)-like permease
MSILSTQPNENKAIKILFAFAAIYIIWGTTYLAIRLAVETIPPFLMAGTRFMIAGIATFAFLRARGVPMPKRLHWRSAVIIGAFLLVGGNGFVTWSEQQVPSGIAALVIATVPLWMVLFDWLAFSGTRPSKKIVAGLVLGFLGIGLLIGPRVFQATTGISWLSWLILFMAPVLWSLGSLHSRRAKLPENTFMSTAMEMLAGGVLLLLAGLITGEAAELNVAQVTTRSLVSMLYLTVFGSIIALTAYVWLLKTVQAARVSTYTYVNPVIAVFLGWLVLGESITTQMLVAAVIIIMAVILITAQGRNKGPEWERTYGHKPSPTLSPQLAGAAPKSDTVALQYTNMEKAGSLGTGERTSRTSSLAGIRYGD